jgi:dephospho-CoA kinase
MPAIGITGGIATGKTALSDCLREIFPGARFFNADEAARTVVDDPEVTQEIRLTFGAGVFSVAGDLNRERLRTIVFADATKRRLLERILHPRIRRQWRAEAKKHRNSPDFFFADIPLLYETRGEILCDRVVVVACSYKVQLARLVQRMSLKETDAEQMIKSQMPLEKKIRRADHVVWNNSNRPMLAEQTRLLAALWQQQTWTKS